MLLAFYVARYGTWLDRWIALATWGPYSHCEFVFSNSVWIGSSPRDGGVRQMSWPLAMERPQKHWIYVTVVVDDRRLWDWCQQEIGKPYDWLGAAVRLPLMNDRWFCSEFCIAGLKAAGYHLPLTQWASPNQLYRAITEPYR